jgi:hypothetical protein
MADPVIRLSIDASGAVNGLEQIDKATSGANRTLKDIRNELKEVANELSGLDAGGDEFAKLTQKAGALKDEIKGISESINANAGPAFENASNNAGRLRSQLATLDFDGAAQSAKGFAQNIKGINFADLQKGIKSFGSSLASLGKALLTNPIFLIGTAIAGLISISGELFASLEEKVNPATERFAKSTLRVAENAKRATSELDFQTRQLRALGKTEEELSAFREETIEKEIIAVRAAQQAQLAVISRLSGKYTEYAETRREEARNTIDELLAREDELIKIQVGSILTVIEKEKEAKKKAAEEAAAAKKKTIKTDQELDDEALKERNDAILKARQNLADQLALLEAKIQSKTLENAKAELKVVQQSEFDKLLAKQRAATASEEIDRQVRATEVALASDALGAISQLSEAFAGQNEASARRAFQLNKAASIAQAIISTYQGVNAIFATSAANPTTVLNPAFPFIQAGIAVAAGLANVARIAKTKFGDTSGGGGGGGARPSSGGGGASSSNDPRSGFAQFDLSQINNRPNQPTPAYVLASDVKTQTEAMEKVQDRARL